jgi:hypothetical protein
VNVELRPASSLSPADRAALFDAAVAANVQLDQIAGMDAVELLQTVRARGTVHALNVPLDNPSADAFRALGGSVTVRQSEMVVAL